MATEWVAAQGAASEAAASRGLLLPGAAPSS